MKYGETAVAKPVPLENYIDVVEKVKKIYDCNINGSDEFFIICL